MEAASSSSTLEKREASKRAWQRKGVATDTEYQVIALNTDTPYVFQVAAKNEVGVGPFVELSKAVAPRSQFGELSQQRHRSLTAVSSIQF